MADESLLGFARRIERVADEVPEGVAKVHRAAALAADQSVVVATPKDTGRATSNWIASIGAPVEFTRDPFAPGEKGSTGEANNAAAMEQALKAVGGHRPGQTIYITNNLPYIMDLDRGSSPQADPGYVSSAINAAISSIRSGRIKVLRG